MRPYRLMTTQPPFGVRELAPAFDNSNHSKRLPWPHAPVHRLGEAGVYMVTAATSQRLPMFQNGASLRLLHDALLTIANKYSWTLQAWSVFANHYHFVAAAPNDASTLTACIRELHSRTAAALNRYENTPGRQVWHNYWDTQLTHETSYLARLHYVHQNPVKHGLTTNAANYPWCSAAWFEQTASPAQVKTVYSFKIDQLKIPDDY